MILGLIGVTPDTQYTRRRLTPWIHFKISLMFSFNSVYFVYSDITHYKFAFGGLYTLYTYDIPVKK